MTVKYTIEAKPTKYNGVNFRSRLEAKWAAFFDLTSKKWDYEPIDFGAWSPDFIVELGVGSFKAVFVEVKPILELDQETANKIANSPASVPALFGINNNHTWFNIHGHWEDYYALLGCDYEWKEACNIVQWHYK